MNIASRLHLAVLLVGFTASAQAEPVNVNGGSGANPVNITELLLRNADVNLTGGEFVVKLPQAGSGIVQAASVDPILNRIGNNGFSSADNPAIRYTGVISGNGAVTVVSGFRNRTPASGQLFDGGALIFVNPAGQTWGVEGVASGGHNAPALTIGDNVTVEFFDKDQVRTANAFPFSATKSRNIKNDGYLYASASNIWASITGTGITVFQFAGGSGATSGMKTAAYSGRLFDFNHGMTIQPGTVFEDQPGGAPTMLESSDITVHRTANDQGLAPGSKYKIGDILNLVPYDIHMGALNIQIWGSGIAQYTGTLLPLAASKSHLELTSFSDAVRSKYHYGSGALQFDTVNLTNRVTMLMGDGRDVRGEPDGVTNNVFMQGNPFNTLLSTNNFETRSSGYAGQALALAYSGSYRVNFNMNAAVTGSGAGPYVVQGIRNNDWVNLLILDPKAWNPVAAKPNNPKITVPVFFAGLTYIASTAVLELGDGTVGNDLIKTTSLDSKTITSRYNDSMGNGMLMTQGNQSHLTKAVAMNAGVKFEIVNDGRLIVNNTPNAISATAAGGGMAGGVSAEVAAWVSENQLDGIAGIGSVEQWGKLPLTLGSPLGNPNTFTGGTKVVDGATLIVAAKDALGLADPGKAGSGSLVNQGTVMAGKGQRVIRVPGDFLQ